MCLARDLQLTGAVVAVGCGQGGVDGGRPVSSYSSHQDAAGASSTGLRGNPDSGSLQLYSSARGEGGSTFVRRTQVSGRVPGRSTARRCPRCSLQNSNRNVLLERVDAFAQA